MTKIIYAFINGTFGGSDLTVVALGEDGRHLASHISSSEFYAHHDIGITSDWKHDIYDAAYPEGWEIEWVPTAEVKTHPGLLTAYAKNQEQPA